MAEWPCCRDPLRSSPASHGFVPPPSTPIQKFRLGRMMIVKDIASKDSSLPLKDHSKLQAQMRHACQRYCEQIYRIGGKQSTRKNMKYYDSMMSTNMSKNVLATTATITSKEAIPKFKGTISHGHPTSSNDEKTARTKSLSSHKDE